jgi:predicted aspartyl protease
MKPHRLFLIVVSLCLWPCISTAQTATIPLELNPAGLMVHIHINGKDATMIVDTGSAITVLSDRLIKDQPQIKKMSINTPTGSVSASLKTADLCFGPVLVKSANVLAMDMKPVSRRAGVEIDGLLGLNVLTSQQGAFQIDLRTQALILGARRQNANVHF